MRRKFLYFLTVLTLICTLCGAASACGESEKEKEKGEDETILIAGTFILESPVYDFLYDGSYFVLVQGEWQFYLDGTYSYHFVASADGDVIMPTFRGAYACIDGYIGYYIGSGDQLYVLAYNGTSVTNGTATFTLRGPNDKGECDGSIARILYNASVGGTIEGQAEQVVARGTDGTAVTAVPKDGYAFERWSDGNTNPTRYEQNAVGYYYLQAIFREDGQFFDLKYDFRGEYGSGYLEGETTQRVPYGRNGTTVRAVANEYYAFMGWSDGVMDPVRQDMNVTQDIDVYAIFGRPNRVFTFTCSEGGTLTGGDLVQVIPYGWTDYPDPEKVTAVPDVGYEFVGWYTDCDGYYESAHLFYKDYDFFTFSFPSQSFSDQFTYTDIHVEARFEKINYYEGDSSHFDLRIGEICRTCGLALFEKYENSVLMQYQDGESDYLLAEFYGDSARFEDNRYAYQVKHLYLSPDVKRIEAHAFEQTPIESVTIPQNSKLETIERYAFWHCYNLTEFIVPDSVPLREVGDQAFAECYSLVNSSFPESLYYVGEKILYHSRFWNTQEDGVVYLDYVLLGYKGQMPERTFITVKEGTTVIADCGFKPEKSEYGWPIYNLRVVELPSSLLRIGNYAFACCEDLTEVTLPQGLLSIGDLAFAECTRLTELSIPDSVTEFGQGVVYGCSSLKILRIGSGVTELRDYYDAYGYWHGFFPSSLTDVYYNGTIEQWKKITSQIKFAPYAPVHCNDGDIPYIK